METLRSRRMDQETAVEAVTLKKGRETTSIQVPRLADTIRAARGLYLDMKALEPAYREYVEMIASVAKDYIDSSGSLTFEVDGISCRVRFSYVCQIPAEHIDEVRRLLGDRFEDLVRTKIKYEGTTKLIDMAADGDRGKEIAKHLVVRESAPSLKFEAA